MLTRASGINKNNFSSQWYTAKVRHACFTRFVLGEAKAAHGRRDTIPKRAGSKSAPQPRPCIREIKKCRIK